MTRHLFIVLLALALAACKPTPDAVASKAAIVTKPAAIAWFEGTLEEAFQRARTQEKPVFVFWSAQWCPYCQSVKSTVFTRSDFIEQSKQVIPVELDGDEPEAHKWGTQFKVVGYPTLLIFRSDRTEIARVSGGMDLNQYATVLSRVLKDERPIEEVLATANTVQACGRLAYHGWDLQDEGDPAVLEKLIQSLTSAAARCPNTDTLDRTRLSLHALGAALRLESEALEQDKPASAGLTERVRELSTLLAGPDQLRGAIDLLVSLDSSLYRTVIQQGPQFSETFRKQCVATLLRAADDANYGESERLLSYATALDAEKELSATHSVPADMADAGRERVTAALELDRRNASRSDIANAARMVYTVLGDDDNLYNMLKAEIATSRTPYYYMPTLASIEERRGRPSQALGWLEMAYTSTRTPGARAKWGSTYVNGLTRLLPNELTKIETISLEVADAMNERDAQSEKTPDRAARLTTPLEKWATTPQRKAVVSAVTQRLRL